MGEDETEEPDNVAGLVMLVALSNPGFAPVETPEAFLASVCKALKVSDNVDAGLADILSDHLLTVTPHANAVSNARVAIVALAARRAAAGKEQAYG